MRMMPHTVEMAGISHKGCLGGKAVREHSACSGVKYSDSKRQLPALMFNFLGHLHDFTQVSWSKVMLWGPKLTIRERLVEMCSQALTALRLSSGQAAKIRGLASWLDASLAGRCMRGAMHAYIARQYWDQGEQVVRGSSLYEALLYTIAVARNLLDRSTRLIGPELPPILVYTDAAADESRVRLGAKVLVPEGKVEVAIYDVTPEIRSSWGPQDTVINQAELECGVMVAATFANLLQGRRVIWWVDNTAAAAALVKAGSPTVTMSRIALQTHPEILRHRVGAVGTLPQVPLKPQYSILNSFQSSSTPADSIA